MMKTPKREVVTNKVVSERLRWSVESNLCLLYFCSITHVFLLLVAT